MFPRPDFFKGSLLNFAENLLYPTQEVDPNSPAIIEANEAFNYSITWAELRERVRLCSVTLRAHGIQPHDRIAGFLGNHANTVVAMLAAATIGAVWTGVSPDTGVTAVLDRLVQIEPRILFVDNAVRYNGKVHSSAAKVKEIVASLKKLEHCVVFQTVEGSDMAMENLTVVSGKAWTYADFIKRYVNTMNPAASKVLISV
jgi:acetoacetyl-CoA synthetase